MNATSLSPLTICLLLSVCLLGSNASANSSLWGKKISFDFPPCMWQLKPDTVVPALEELSVCVLLRLNIKTKWTGFVYKAPGKSNIELGLQGSSKHLEVWLFGKQHRLDRNLAEKEWFSVCLTWSGRVQRLRVYINGTSQLESSVDPQQLAKNGTLTLGASHFVQPSGALRPESGTNLYGEIGLFRMWDREWSAEELSNQSCAGRDVLSWDSKQWKYNCKLIPDNKLQCAWPLYKIKMWTFITYTSRPGSCSVSLEKVTAFWLDSVFPRNVSVHDISVSSPSHDCHGVNNSAALHVQQPQGLQANSSSCSQCFWCEVYVKVEPAANVGLVQEKLNAALISTLSHDSFNLTVDPNSISILPVETLPPVTDPKPTLSTGETTSETGPTQSLPAPPANMSTTGEPLDLNETAMGPDVFFRVNLTLSMIGGPTKPLDVIQKWVKQQLEVNLAMTVVNLIVREKSGRHTERYSEIMIFQRKEKQYYCTFHVQDKKNTVNESQTLIEAALKSKYDNGSISIQTMDLMIANIQPTNCFEQEVLTIYGDYFWPETFPQEKQEMGCVKPVTKRAYRLCKLDIETDTTSWAPPDMRECEPIQSIPGLKNVTVTIGNAAEVVDMIRDLVDKDLGSDDELSPSDLDTVVGKLNEVVNISIIRPDVGADIVNIVSAILLSKTDITPVANIVLNMTEMMGNNMDFLDESVNVTAPSLALSMINVDPNEFKGLTFGVASISSNLDPKVFLNQTFVGEPLLDTIAMISLPSALNDFFHPGQKNTTRVQFQFYGTQELFQDPLTTNATHSTWKLNPYVVSASINNSHVMNLKDPVVVTFNHPKPEHPEDKFRCMFWDFHKNSGQGGWDSRGCVTHSISPNCTSCLCDHLTHFAVLLDVSRAPISAADSQILTVISYLGCGISSIFLGITLLTYLAFEKLRRDYPSKILINLSAALLGLCMLFLVNSWLSSFSNYGLCIATAATLHYFLLASFTWMGLEAVHMYLALIKVFNTYIPSYILKFCAVGWGVPLVIVSLVLAIDKDAYGSAAPEEAAVALQSTEQFCWLLSDVFFYVTVVAFVLLILLCNISVFVVVLIQIRKMRANKRSTNSCVSLYDLRAVASLTVLLGLTWAMAFFSFGPARLALMYLFSILNSLQGFFVFLFHCLMKENVRKQWRIHLCCGRLRLKDCSEWSGTVSAGGPHRRNILVNSDSVASNSTSTIRKVSDSSTGSAPNHHQGA